MTGASEAAAALLAVAADGARPIKAAIETYRLALARLLAADDFNLAMRDTASIIQAVAALTQASKAMEERLRRALANEMDSTGAPAFRLPPDHVVETRRQAPGVIVTDREAIPAEYWTEPRPDLKRIAPLLRRKKNPLVIPGVVLGNAGLPVLVIRRVDAEIEETADQMETMQ